MAEVPWIFSPGDSQKLDVEGPRDLFLEGLEPPPPPFSLEGAGGALPLQVWASTPDEGPTGGIFFSPFKTFLYDGLLG